MDLTAARESIAGFPQVFFSKTGKKLRMQLLDWNLEGQFVGRYLDYEPRNSFQGLPPLKDDVCAKWAKEMILTGVNLVAVCPRAGIVGHTALFPIDESCCELLAVVWPEFQNQGIGTALTQGCVQIARQLGFEKIWLPVDSINLRARRVYEKCGFECRSPRLSRELEMVCNVARNPVFRADENTASKRIPLSVLFDSSDSDSTLMNVH
jgi:GNAT superfamily N-acetyltransferase